MGVLSDQRHERFCQEVHRLLGIGNALGAARTEAYALAGFESEDTSRPHNARRLANMAHVKVRISELADYSSKMAGIDAGWALLQLKKDFEEIGGFNLDDYLSPPDKEGNRYYDLALADREQMALLTELAMETSTEVVDKDDDDSGVRHVHKVKLKGPDKYPQRRAIIAQMAAIAGWEAPKKIAPTSPDGKEAAHLTLGALVLMSMANGESPSTQPQSGALEDQTAS